MVKTPIKAVVWDLDGTLIHFKIDFMRARREAFKILKEHGIPKKYLSMQNGTIDTIVKSRKIFESNGLSKQKINSNALSDRSPVKSENNRTSPNDGGCPAGVKEMR